MDDEIVILRLMCHVCDSVQPHVMQITGSFSCLNCRVNGHSTMRFLMHTCTVDSVPKLIPE